MRPRNLVSVQGFEKSSDCECRFLKKLKVKRRENHALLLRKSFLVLFILFLIQTNKKMQMHHKNL